MTTKELLDIYYKGLESLQSVIKKQHSSMQIKVTTTIIKNADHMYTGEEGQVAETIKNWTDSILKDGNNQ
jgi:alpha/beta superfamily hydrolase